jgi:beta-mannanase
VLAAVAIGATVLVVAASGDGEDEPRRARRGTELLLGVATPSGPRATGELDAFAQIAGRDVQIVSWYQHFTSMAFDRDAVQKVTARGAIPLVTLEPWDSKKGVEQPDYRLRRIASGAYDDELTAWAEDAREWGGRILLRFAHEMNGDWYPWSEQVNGNRPGDYVVAWRHVHDVFDRAGADNVEWVWSPNVAYEGSTSFDGLYPGDDYTDWVALDGYNFGTGTADSSRRAWKTFDQVFDDSLRAMERLAPDKPLLIAEVGCAEQGGDKAAWITDMFEQLAYRPDVTGIVWFNIEKRADWPLTTSVAAALAFRHGLASAAPDAP